MDALKSLKIETVTVKCDFCGGEKFIPLFDNMRHGLNLPTVLCENCALCLTNPQPSEATLASFYENYYRLDLKVGFTLNSANKNRSHTLSLDLQNVTNHKNIFSQNYDNKTQTIHTKYQLVFFPNVVYKLQF